MVVKCCGGRGDIIHGIAFLPYYGIDNKLVIIPGCIPAGFSGTKYAGPEILEEDVKQFHDFLSKQDYITEVVTSGNYEIDLDEHRKYANMKHVLGKMAAVYKIPDQSWRISKDGWIDKSKYNTNRHDKKIIINKSLRYHSGSINYKLLEEFKNDCGFIGTQNEYEAFCRNFVQVDYLKTDTITDFAEVLYSSKLFIGNQSFANCLCNAAAHPRILEVWNGDSDPYTYNGHTELTSDIINNYIKDN